MEAPRQAMEIARELLRSPVVAAFVLLAGLGIRGCGSIPLPPIPVPEPAAPKEPGNIFPKDAPDPPAPHVFEKSPSTPPSPPRWEWRDLGPGWTVPVEGYGREVDGQFLFFQIRKKGGTTVQSVETGALE